MATKITSANFAPAILAAIVGPAISSVQIASDNTFATTLDDNAVPLTGGYIVLNGTGFVTGCQVYLDSTIATTVTFVSSTRINVQVPALAAGTYVIYLVNGDGSIAIRVNGLTYSLTPTWATSSDLGSVPDGTAVSLQLAAPSDSTTTYTLQAGSTLPTGLTLSSTGLLSGIVSVASATTYNFTVVATDIELQDSPRTFSVSITLGDIYFNNTVLLLNGETATTNWIADASTNSFNITPAGDAKPSAFSPYNTSWSNYFDGTGDYLTTTGAALDTGAGTSDFTMECWVYNNGYSGSQYGRGIFTFYPSAGYANSRIMFRLNNGGNQINIYLYISGTLHANITSTVLATPGAWTHVAYIRQSGTFKLYINGTIESSMTVTGVSASLSTFDKFDIGRNQDGNLPDFNGYISNFRYVKGTAVYTANFTPSTAPLTAVANTVLLTCQSNRFKDNSTNNFTLTRNGDVAVKTFSPFTETDAVTGSGYFDGTGDYLSLPSAISFGSANFTVETWVYPTSVSTNMKLFGAWTGYQFWFGTNGRVIWQFGGSNSPDIAALYVSLNQWAHIAWVRSGNSMLTFINGVLKDTTSYAGTVSSGTLPVIGKSSDAASDYYYGYISDLRVTTTAVYTADFAPPTAPLTTVTNTNVLTLQNRTGHNNNTALDTSGNKLLGTKFGNATQGTFTPFSQPAGYWSNQFNVTSISSPSSSNLVLGAGDFTIEMWVYNSGSLDGRGIFQTSTVTGVNSSYQLAIAWNNATFFLQTGAWNQSTTGVTVVANRWYHLALVKSGSTINLYVDGVNRLNRADTFTYTDTYVTVGGYYSLVALYAMVGYVSNFRVVGSAVYTTAFTPPIAPLTAIANTKLLTCQSNRFTDASTNNFTLTASGVTQAQTFIPFKPTASYAAAINGGSGYYDGTGDYHLFPLVLPNVGNFTFEFWAYSTASVSGLAICGSSEFEVYLSGLNISWVYQGLIAFSSGFNFIPGQWNHIVICRYNWVLNAAGLFKMFVNGQMYSHATAKGENMPIPGPFITGGSYYTNAFRTPWPGYISNVRFINGNGTIYTAAFTPPTAPVTATNDTVLQLNFTNAGVIDQSGRNDLETVGDARISTTVKKYGTGSMSFDGTGDYLYAASSPNFELSSGDFTVEAWIYPTTIAGAERGIFGIGTTDPDSNLVRIQGSSSKLQFWLGGSNSGGPGAGTKTGIITCSTVLSLNTWYHIALVRSGSATNNVKLYLNGVSDGQGTATYTIGAKPFGLGMSYPNSAIELFIGHIDEFRITKGVARYTANFTPPTTAVLTK